MKVLNSECVQRRPDGVVACDILKKWSVRHDEWLVVISVQEEKAKIFVSLHDQEIDC